MNSKLIEILNKTTGKITMYNDAKLMYTVGRGTILEGAENWKFIIRTPANPGVLVSNGWEKYYSMDFGCESMRKNVPVSDIKEVLSEFISEVKK